MAELVQVVGLKEIEAKLKALPDHIAGKGGGPMLKALRRMGSRIAADAKRRVPVDTGTLKQNIITSRISAKDRRATGQDGVEVTVRAKARKYKDSARNRKAGKVGGSYNDYGALYYARFLEFGTSKMSARPFLTPAFESVKPELPQMFVREMTRAIDEAVKKLASRP